MGTAMNDSAQPSSKDAAILKSSETGQAQYELVIAEQLRIVAIPTSEERFAASVTGGNYATQNNRGAMAGRHLGRPTFLQRVFGWLI